MGVSCFVGAVRSVEGSPIVPFLVVGKDCFIAGGSCSCIIPSFEINSLLEKILRGNSPPGFSAWVMSYDPFYCGETFHLWLSISLLGVCALPFFRHLHIVPVNPAIFCLVTAPMVPEVLGCVACWNRWPDGQFVAAEGRDRCNSGDFRVILKKTKFKEGNRANDMKTY